MADKHDKQFDKTQDGSIDFSLDQSLADSSAKGMPGKGDPRKGSVHETSAGDELDDAGLQAASGTDGEEVENDTKNDAATVSSVGALSDRSGPQEMETRETASQFRKGSSIFADKYELIRQIGEGGMGAVWLAHQLEPVRRSVAVKVIRDDMDSKSILARFALERQSLAMMDHPNIARVLDAGETESQPFFVMELVDGVPITKFCDEHRLTIAERLRLFAQVCRAIQHAHQKGVIHRDIKPSNVLVARFDEKPVPKVIDFGVAKAAEPMLPEDVRQTAIGTIVGTPEYMSPEQARLGHIDVDTRSDFYSLGALLFELLTGSTPVDRKSLRDRSTMEVLRIVRDVDAPRPSLKLQSSVNAGRVSESRRTEATKLRRQLRRELDWIVLKALEKDRSRRYETASGFALDIDRYLAGEPVQAHPPSASYRFKKMLRRNRIPATAAAFVFLTLVGGVVGTTMGLFEAQKQEKLAISAGNLARTRLNQVAKQKELAEQAGDLARERLVQIKIEKRRADDETAVARAVNDFLQDGILGQLELSLKTDPAFRAEPNLTLRTILDRAAAEVGNAFLDQPLVEIELRHTIGNAYRSVGEYEKSIEQLQRAYDLAIQHLGEDDHNNWVMLHNLAMSQNAAGEELAAIDSLEQALVGLRRHDGPFGTNTLVTIAGLAGTYEEIGESDKAIQLLEAAFAGSTKEHGPKHLTTLLVRTSLGDVYRTTGRVDEAIEIFTELRDVYSAKLGVAHLRTIGVLNSLGLAYTSAGRADEAIEIFESNRDEELKQLGEVHPDTMTTLHNLAGAYDEAGREEEAIEVYIQVTETLAKRYGANHVTVMQTKYSLASLYNEVGEFEKALELCKRVRDGQLEKLGPEHPSTLNTLHTLAGIYRDIGKLQLALELYESVVKSKTDVHGEAHPDTLSSMDSLAGVLQSLGEGEESIRLRERVCELRTRLSGAKHPATLSALSNLGGAYRANGETQKAIDLLEKVRDDKIEAFGVDHPDLLPTLNNLGVAYGDAGRREDSVKMAEQVHAGMAKAYGADHAKTLNSLANAAVGHWSLGRLEKSVPMFEEVLRRQEATLGRDHPATMLTAANLAVNYRDAKRVDESIELFEEAYEASKKYPSLRWIGDPLFEVYVQTRNREKSIQLAAELVSQAESQGESKSLADTLQYIARSLFRVKAFAEAEPMLLKAVEIMKKHHQDDWLTSAYQVFYGHALLHQEKYEEAEPALLAGYEGLSERIDENPESQQPYVTQAIRALVKLYRATEKPEKVKEWQEKLIP